MCILQASAIDYVTLECEAVTLLHFRPAAPSTARALPRTPTVNPLLQPHSLLTRHLPIDLDELVFLLAIRCTFNRLTSVFCRDAWPGTFSLGMFQTYAAPNSKRRALLPEVSLCNISTRHPRLRSR